MTTNPQPRLIPVEELFADPAFILPTISPDGTRIAYLASHYGRRNIWVREVEQAHDDAVPVTDDTRRGITTCHWTDDPRRPTGPLHGNRRRRRPSRTRARSSADGGRLGPERPAAERSRPVARAGSRSRSPGHR